MDSSQAPGAEAVTVPHTLARVAPGPAQKPLANCWLREVGPPVLAASLPPGRLVSGAQESPLESGLAGRSAGPTDADAAR
jgi:hypothetical protein